MRILIEEYQYTLTDEKRQHDLKCILKELGGFEDVEGKICINYVGYYYSAELKDCVFILPKVLITVGENKNELAFGEHRPEDIINIDKDSPLSEDQRRFIYEFAVWIYRAIDVYRTKNQKSGIIYHKHIAEMSKGRRRVNNTFLDVLLSLIQFNKDNQNFFFFTLRNQHSGLNKINWTKTISKSQAFVQDDAPVYLNPVNKRRQINFDEELLVIFFSILNYINEKYGFSAEININFPLIPKAQFENYMKGMGKTRLHQIKYKYFSDKAIQLWELCYAFFDRSHQITISSELQEYLLAKNFNIVFEAIIDELIGEKIPEDNKRLRQLKEQPDGKMVDHIYRYKDLALSEEESDKSIYYIGDSKYYKRGHVVGENSVYKQFTYARNVIQWNIDLFSDDSPAGLEEQKDHYKLRDDETEGYNIIPNFFISAQQNDLKAVDDIRLTDNGKTDYSSSQFENRLFDRDTFLIAHYDVNFLFVIALYGRNNKSQKEQWKAKVREMFRKHIQDMLKEKYKFYAMKAKPSVDAKEYIRKHFQDVLGKIYTPFESHPDYFSLALDITDPENNNEELLAQLGKAFVIAECGLGKNPEPVLAEAQEKGGIASCLNMDDIVLVCRTSNEEHLNWCHRNKCYNIPIENAQNPMDIISAKYAVLKPNGTNLCQGLYKIVNGKFALLTKEQLIAGGENREAYPRTPHRDAYFMIDLNGRDENIKLYSDFPLNLNNVKPYKGTTSNPYYLVKLEDLLKI